MNKKQLTAAVLSAVFLASTVPAYAAEKGVSPVVVITTTDENGNPVRTVQPLEETAAADDSSDAVETTKDAESSNADETKDDADATDPNGAAAATSEEETAMTEPQTSETATKADEATAAPAEDTPKDETATGAPAAVDEEALLDSRKISINLAARSLAVYEGDKRIRLYPIGPGKASTPTPVGYYKVESKDLNPTWTDPTDPEYSIPSGESNPLGYRWMEFQGNYGIHGTNKPESIGHYVSNGCVRMNEKDVEAVFDLVKVGTPIEITYNRIVVEKTPDDQIAFYIYPDGYGRQPLDVAEATRWLKGYGVENFISDEDIEQKIAASDGEPTYIGKVYNILVEGKKLAHKAVTQNGVTYLPALELADVTGISLGWDETSETLISTIGKARGYNKKDYLYCSADDAGTLFGLQGGLSGKQYVYTKKKAQPKTTQPAQPTTESSDTAKSTEATEAAEKTQTDEKAAATAGAKAKK